MPSSRAADHSQPRRDPFSCQTCRVKKLKCDRQQPCSNCKTRRLACEYARNSSLTALPAGLAGRRANFTAENEDLKARIRRLEQAVFGSHASKALPTPQYGKDSLSTSEAKRGSTSAAIDSEWLEGIGTRLNDVVGVAEQVASQGCPLISNATPRYRGLRALSRSRLIPLIISNLAASNS